MKKMICFACLMNLLMGATCAPAYGEPERKIKEAVYENKELKGSVVVPDDRDYYVRLAFFMDSGDLVITTKKIEKDGTFSLKIYVPCNYISVFLVDREDAFSFGTYEIYDSLKGGAIIK